MSHVLWALFGVVVLSVVTELMRPILFDRSFTWGVLILTVPLGVPYGLFMGWLSHR